MKIFKPQPDKASAVAAKFADRLRTLAQINREVAQDLFTITGKKAKGDQIVALLGETVVAELLGGKVLPEEGSETDVLVGETRISVKTRRGSGSGWTQTSTISTNNLDAVDYLAFVHLDDNYLVDKVWMFPWKDIVQAGRVKEKTVRGIPRGFLFRLAPQNDEAFQVYP